MSGAARRPDGAVCDVALCPALAADADGLCAVHAGAKRVDHPMTGMRCVACRRLLESGEYVTRESTLDAMTHASCPPARVAAPRKINRPKPLIDAIDAVNADARELETITSTDVDVIDPADIFRTEL